MLEYFMVGLNDSFEANLETNKSISKQALVGLNYFIYPVLGVMTTTPTEIFKIVSY